MNLLLLLLAFAFGAGVGIVCVIPSLIIVIFAIPFTALLNWQGAMKTYAPIAQYSVSLVLLIGIFWLLSWAVWRYFNNVSVGYLAGVAMAVVLGIKRLGANSDNIADYLRSHARRLDPEWMSKTGRSAEEEELRLRLRSFLGTP